MIRMKSGWNFQQCQRTNIATRALLEGKIKIRNNPAHEEFFNSLISGLIHISHHIFSDKGECSCCTSSQNNLISFRNSFIYVNNRANQYTSYIIM